jgi:hypothetical protein
MADPQRRLTPLKYRTTGGHTQPGRFDRVSTALAQRIRRVAALAPSANSNRPQQGCLTMSGLIDQTLIYNTCD